MSEPNRSTVDENARRETAPAPAKPARRRRRWTLATALGFCGGFAAMPVVSALGDAVRPDWVPQVALERIPEHLRPDSLPPWMDLSMFEALYRWALVTHVFTLLLFGAILGAAQYFVIRRRLPGAWRWIPATSIGFTAVLLLELVHRQIVTGPTAGPVEPIVIVVGGGALAGVVQWALLKRSRDAGLRYLGFLCLGLALGVLASFPAMLAIGSVLSGPIGALQEAAPHLAWGVEIGTFGLIFGAVAGWIGSYGHAALWTGTAQGPSASSSRRAASTSGRSSREGASSSSSALA
jgi:hypothetical protein